MNATLQKLLGLEALGTRPDTGLILNTLSPTPLVPPGPSAQPCKGLLVTLASPESVPSIHVFAVCH
jgi:hypothetical protein